VNLQQRPFSLQRGMSYSPGTLVLRDYLLAVWRYRRAIAVATVLSGLAGFVYSRIQPPQYRADAVLRVRASDQVREAPAVSLAVTEAFREISDSLRDVENLRKALAGRSSDTAPSDTAPASVEDFRDKQLSVLPVPGTRFLQIGVTLGSAESAITVANALAAGAIDRAAELERQRVNVKRAAIESRLTIVARQLEETEPLRGKPTVGHASPQSGSSGRIELDREAMRVTYSRLAQELYELELPAAATLEVVSPAAAARSLSAPSTQVALFAAIAGLLAATLLAAFIVYIRFADTMPQPRERV
jgi:uncharacterized protein involved in exopolysaccharide biosynthesis